MANEGHYTYKEDREITLPAASSSLAVEKREWERLKNIVNKCKKENQWFMSVAFCFFGIGGSAFFTRLSLLSQKELSNIQLVLMIVTITSLVVGGICIAFQVYLNRNERSNIESIKEEIYYIEGGMRKEEANG